MAEPILCEYLLKLATEPHTRERFFKLGHDERRTFLINLGLHEGAATALAKVDGSALKAYVEMEINPKGDAPIGGHHTIQMTINLPDSLTTHGK